MSKRLSKEGRTAVSRSGYLMEQRIAAWVQDRGYYTVPNYSFKDPETGHSREIDIWAMGAEMITRRRHFEFIFPVLLIECKNLRAPLVFFTRSEAPTRHLMGDVHLSGLPKEVLVERDRNHLSDYLKLEDFHHYYQRTRIASQFCVVARGKGNDLVASHELPPVGNLYESVVLPLVKAVHFEVDDHESNWKYVPGEEVINLQFYYPIFVTRGEIYECFVGGTKPTYKRVHRINFMRRYHSERVKGEYRIDVVTESGFRRLMRTIEDEITQIARRIKRKKIVLRKSANLIARERKRRKPRSRPHK